MALEDVMERLIVALDNNTASRNAGRAAGATTAASATTANVGGATPVKRGPGRPAGSTNKPAASKFTGEQVKAKIIEVKEALGTPEAQRIIKESGAGGLNELLTKTDKFDSVMAACEQALAPSETDELDGGVEDDLG